MTPAIVAIGSGVTAQNSFVKTLQLN